jgi:capsular exopolysaccharide synthesis family protein
MSRTYEALKRAERRWTSPPLITRAGQWAVSDIGPDLDDGARAEYERIQLWITNRSAQDSPIQTVMVASCQRRNGATTTAANLASTLAQGPAARVLIVDANLRTPRLDRLFGARDRRGFSELLDNANGADAIQPSTRPNLFVLTSGRIPPYPLEILSPAPLGRLVAQLKSRFDFIVFDAPPLLEFPDAYALAAHVDAVLVVVEADRTLVDDARRVMRDLERAGARAAGVVLNRQRDYTPRLFRRKLNGANGSRRFSR